MDISIVKIWHKVFNKRDSKNLVVDHLSRITHNEDALLIHENFLDEQWLQVGTLTP